MCITPEQLRQIRERLHDEFRLQRKYPTEVWTDADSSNAKIAPGVRVDVYCRTDTEPGEVRSDLCEEDLLVLRVGRDAEKSFALRVTLSVASKEQGADLPDVIGEKALGAERHQ